MYPTRASAQFNLQHTSYQTLRLGALTPKPAIIQWSQAQTQMHLPLTNLTDAPITAEIMIEPQDAQALIQLSVPQASSYAFQTTSIELLPHETRQIPITIQPLARPLVGLGQNNFFMLSVYDVVSGQKKTVLGHFQCRALLGAGVMVAAALLILILIGLQWWSSVSIETPLIQDTTVTRNDLSDVDLPRSSKATAEIVPTVTSTPINQAPDIETVETTNTIDTSLEDDPITYEAMFILVADQYDLDWRILAAQAYYESQINPYALGQDRDMGLMQIIPTTWAIWSKKVDITDPDPYDAYHNLQVAARYHQYLKERLQTKNGCDELHWVLTAYNWGPHNVLSLPDCDESWNDVPLRTRRYVSKILNAASQSTLPFSELEAEVTYSTISTD